MENTNMHENIHTNNKEITPLLSGLGENCEKNDKNRTFTNKGFSLVEVLVCIALIALTCVPLFAVNKFCYFICHKLFRSANVF